MNDHSGSIIGPPHVSTACQGLEMSRPLSSNESSQKYNTHHYHYNNKNGSHNIKNSPIGTIMKFGK